MPTEERVDERHGVTAAPDTGLPVVEPSIHRRGEDGEAPAISDAENRIVSQAQILGIADGQKAGAFDQADQPVGTDDAGPDWRESAGGAAVRDGPSCVESSTVTSPGVAAGIGASGLLVGDAVAVVVQSVAADVREGRSGLGAGDCAADVVSALVADEESAVLADPKSVGAGVAETRLVSADRA